MLLSERCSGRGAAAPGGERRPGPRPSPLPRGLGPRTAPGPRSPRLAEHFQEHFPINPEVPERPEESQERAQQYGYYRMIFGKKVLMGNLVFILKLLTMIFLW